MCDLSKCSELEFRIRFLNAIMFILVLIDLAFGNIDLLFIEIPILVVGLLYWKFLNDKLFRDDTGLGYSNE